MRIISKYKDYYDSVQAYGSDPKTIYIRKEKEFDKNEKNINFNFYPFWNDDLERQLDLNFLRSENGSLCFESFYLIYFCGNTYPCFEIGQTKEFYPIGSKIKTFYCYDLKSINKLIKLYGSKKGIKRWNSNKKNTFRWFTQSIKQKQIKELIEKFTLKSNPAILKYHHELGVPCFMFKFSDRNFTLILNPILKDIKFYKVFDTFKTYQEISMFISGIMGGQSPPMIEISDRCRKEMHGFDKWSFRKEPTKGK